MKLKTWHFENTVVAAILLTVWAATGHKFEELIGSIAVFCGFCHASIAERMREREAARPVPSVECHDKLETFFWAKEVSWIAYFTQHHAWSAIVGCAVFAAYPFWRRYWRSIHPMERTAEEELANACKAYREGSIAGGDFLVSLKKAGIPTSVIEVVEEMHSSCVAAHQHPG